MKERAGLRSHLSSLSSARAVKACRPVLTVLPDSGSEQGRDKSIKLDALVAEQR
jgi:hypothetical protein